MLTSPDRRYLALTPSRVVPRPAPARSNHLADFVKRFPRCRVERPTLPGAEQRYLDLLDEVVADERITVEEAAALEACARTGGLTQGQLEYLHRRAFFVVLGAEANMTPAMLSAVRKRELLTMAEALGVASIIELFTLLAEPAVTAASPAAPRADSCLKGWRIGLDHADGDDLLSLREMAGVSPGRPGVTLKRSWRPSTPSARPTGTTRGSKRRICQPGMRRTWPLP